MSAADDRLTAILARAEAVDVALNKTDEQEAAGENYAVSIIPTRIMHATEGSAQDVPDLVAALRAVLDLHVEHESAYEMSGYFCAEDGDDWPCPTVRAIESALGGGAA